jgi:hypothetical protein
MQQQDYHCSITAPVTAEEAFEGISNVRAWWAKHFEGSSTAVHDLFTVRFGTTFVTFEITELIPDRKVVWYVTDCYLPFVQDKYEWNNTSVVWEVEAAGDETRISMTHIGLVPAVECYGQCEAGWNNHIKESLFRYITEHAGMPV